jgi:TolA-binding protein
MSGSPSDSDIPDDDSLPDSPKELGIKLYRQGVFREAAEIFEELKEDFPIEKKDEVYAK